MVDKNLFLYDLAIVAIFKDEGRYLKEWIDYHLLAGVEHFYLYNNDSTDDYKEVLAPYVEKNLVTLTDFPGKIMQCPAYNDAIKKYRFESRYMAFIDIDEFIYPKYRGGALSVVEVVDEILSRDSNAVALGINWQMFGSNGHEKADYSRGVLERFLRCNADNCVFLGDKGAVSGNAHIKTIANPRFIERIFNPHYAVYFSEKFAVNSNGERIPESINYPILNDKIIINHYFTKSKEEFILKHMRGRADNGGKWSMNTFDLFDRNEVFDDGILKYRASRAENFSFESDEQRISRVINALFRTLTQPEDSLVDKLETFLTCRAVAEKFQIKIDDTFAEEIALAWIYKILIKAKSLTYAEIQQFLKALPEILARPFPICKELKDLAKDNVIPRFCEALKNKKDKFSNTAEALKMRTNAIYLQKILSLIK